MGDPWPREALCALRRDARLSAVAVLVVGPRAVVTVFSVVQALVLRPLPFREPGRLVRIDNRASERRAATPQEDLSARTVRVAHVEALWVASRTGASRALADVAGYFPFDGRGDHTLTDRGEPERLTGVQVTGNFFPLLGVRPAAGRPVTLDSEPAPVVRVLPATVDFGTVFAPGTRADLFAPFPLSPETNRNGNTLLLVARACPNRLAGHGGVLGGARGRSVRSWRASRPGAGMCCRRAARP